MAYKIQDIEGIGPASADKLAAAGIATTEDLLEKCCSADGRKQAASSTGVSESQLLTWANMADLMRVSGIGGEYAELLKASGVDTVKELRTRNAANLADKAAQINEQKSLTRKVPTANVIEGWIEAAKSIEPLITH